MSSVQIRVHPSFKERLEIEKIMRKKRTLVDLTRELGESQYEYKNFEYKQNAEKKKPLFKI